MIRKITVVLLILPMALMLTAQGNKEAGKGQGVLLEESYAGPLGDLESGEITPQEARDELVNMQNRFTLRNEERKVLDDLTEGVAAGDITAEQALDGLPDQLRDRTQLRIDEPDQDRIKDQDKTQDKLKDQDKDQDQKMDQDQDCEPDQDRIQDQTGSGSSSGSSGKNKS